VVEHTERSNKNAPIIFGHDEYIFKQYHMTRSAWKSPRGGSIAILKDDGQGIILSGFQSLKFGFGMHLNDNELCLLITTESKKHIVAKRLQETSGRLSRSKHLPAAHF
jgi:hypothetical protein